MTLTKKQISYITKEYNLLFSNAVLKTKDIEDYVSCEKSNNPEEILEKLIEAKEVSLLIVDMEFEAFGF